ncbi:MAG TPA: 50S ribosomal protein L23 [Kosmotogaceae bacterium]|nr:MAG: 50S ribosomal protein L23 [Thermotogales bacterium 46_20]HAA85302.1 50S ribosomal protein L23 [Kosmotogaceae bacterium]
MRSEKLPPSDVIVRPIVTEKSLAGDEEGKYVFEVHKNANKYVIKETIENLFKVKVESVNVVNVKGKPKRRGLYTGKTRTWKKAVVSLIKGYRIKELEGQH